MKIVINETFVDYALSKAAYKFLHLKWDGVGDAYKHDRSNPKLIECVEQLGNKAGGDGVKLVVVECDDDVEYSIGRHGGKEFLYHKI